ncbi:hypothetical protein B0H13DRAFT_1902543 [Mycena leptocephala]|nr:hypothetical protein B0H13DRAFT_1902543 [Mycena leptocephala]
MLELSGVSFVISELSPFAHHASALAFFHPGADLTTQLARWGRLGRDRAGGDRGGAAGMIYESSISLWLQLCHTRANLCCVVRWRDSGEGGGRSSCSGTFELSARGGLSSLRSPAPARCIPGVSTRLPTNVKLARVGLDAGSRRRLDSALTPPGTQIPAMWTLATALDLVVDDEGVCVRVGGQHMSVRTLLFHFSFSSTSKHAACSRQRARQRRSRFQVLVPALYDHAAGTCAAVAAQSPSRASASVAHSVPSPRPSPRLEPHVSANQSRLAALATSAPSVWAHADFRRASATRNQNTKSLNGTRQVYKPKARRDMSARVDVGRKVEKICNFDLRRASAVQQLELMEQCDELSVPVSQDLKLYHIFNAQTFILSVT